MTCRHAHTNHTTSTYYRSTSQEEKREKQNNNNKKQQQQKTPRNTIQYKQYNVTITLHCDNNAFLSDQYHHCYSVSVIKNILFKKDIRNSKMVQMN